MNRTTLLDPSLVEEAFGKHLGLFAHRGDQLRIAGLPGPRVPGEGDDGLRGRVLFWSRGKTMDPKVLHVQADWDPEAEVWVATSDEVPGLATEAETIETLTEKLRTLIPELLEANRPKGAQA